MLVYAVAPVLSVPVINIIVVPIFSSLGIPEIVLLIKLKVIQVGRLVTTYVIGPPSGSVIVSGGIVKVNNVPVRVC